MAGSDPDKEAVAEHAATLVVDGMRLGLGSGSTARAFVAALGRRVANGLSIPPALATSHETARAAQAAGVPLCDGGGIVRLDLAVDGTDEVDPALRLIKGGGGCMLREKIVAQMADRFVVIADGSKRVERLGAFPLPVEVDPFAADATAERLCALGVAPSLRMGRDGPFRTDGGNLVYDCPFQVIAAPDELARALDAVPGVMAHGLFLDEADEVLIASGGRIDRLVADR